MEALNHRLLQLQSLKPCSRLLIICQTRSLPQALKLLILFYRFFNCQSLFIDRNEVFVVITIQLGAPPSL